MMIREIARERLKAGGIEIAKLLGSVAYAALFVAPHAANHAVSTASAEVEVAEFPTTIGFYPGESRIDVLNQASIFLDEAQYGVGVRAEVTGLPRFNSNDQIIDYFSAERLDVYVSLADTPAEAASSYVDRLRDDAVERGLEFEALWAGVGGSVLYGGLALRRLRHRLRELEGDTPHSLSSTQLIGLGAMALAGSLSVADGNFQAWQDSEPRPDGLQTIHALDGTSLSGAQIDNRWALNSVDSGIRYASSLKDRRIEQRQAYLDRSVPVLRQEIMGLPDLRDDEELFFVMTDMHASNAGITLAESSIAALQERYGDSSVKAIYNLGDMYQATEVQRDAVIAQAFPDRDVPVAVSRGNHDPEMSSQWLEDAGMIELRGRESIGGIETYGQPDVQQTPFLRPSYFVDPDVTETTLGEQVREALSDDPTEVLNLHQPAAIGAFLGTERFSSYLASDEDERLTECDYGSGTIDAFPASLIQAGHWHDQYPLKMVCNDDGSWSVINVQGTGGGANESPTWNSWSDPGGKPVKTVSYRAFIRNATYGSITGSIDIQIEPNGTVLPIYRTDIGTEDGAPFPTSSQEAGQARVPERPNQKDISR